MHSHRNYSGESFALDVVEWLNEPSRPDSDAVERLMLAYRAYSSGRDDYSAAKTIRSILRGLKLVPCWEPMFKMKGESALRKASRTPTRMYRVLDRNRSVVQWLPDARGMARGQSLAMFRVTQLHAQGQLDGVRKCENPSCGRWFYSHKRGHRFDSQKCSQEVWRAQPGRRLQRAKYMRDKRRKAKEREERQGFIMVKRKGQRL
jgi:hypothetical protein